MIFLISKNRNLFKSNLYQESTVDEALEWLNTLSEPELDTETKGLDCHTKDLLTIQLGNSKNQYIFDWATLTLNEKQKLKKYLESDRLFLGVNLMFDLTFLYKQNIWPKKIYDIMIAEQLIYLGFPKVITKELVNELGIEFPMYEEAINEDGSLYYELNYSLKSIAKRYLGINIDKTVRGAIINEGLTERVVQYAAGDVMWLGTIKEKQMKLLEEQDLVRACQFECEFVKALAYTKYCGVHLDTTKWKAKMNRDKEELSKSISKLNEWVVNWDRNRHNDWDIKYEGIDFEPNDCFYKENLIKNGYKRSPLDDLTDPRGKVFAFKKKVKSLFTKVDPQGDLFNGFDPEPKCTINWSSQKQVVQLFETIGINCDGFDKKTKKKKKTIEEDHLLPQQDKFPIIPLFLEYQKAAKIVSTYGQNWLNAINAKTGRVHAEIHPIGTDTSRVSSGGGPYKLNQQNLPNDEITRGCFTSEKGNVWLSCDYSGQESRIIASVSKDEAMMDLFKDPKGDVHSLVAYMSYTKEIPRDIKISEIKGKYHTYRQYAKSIEFAINYGGDFNTISNNMNLSIDEAKRIYNNFMEGFPGVKRYQDYCRKVVMKNGYILMNPILKHKAHIFDAPWLLKMQKKFEEDDFWEYYRDMKIRFPQCDTVQSVKRYFRRKSESEKQSINYRIQNRGACAYKLASILFFNWIVSNNYQNIVKTCIEAHDEKNVECPENMKDEVSAKLLECMVEGGKPFCPNVFLGADMSIGDHWIH